jgi:hypothetical protein
MQMIPETYDAVFQHGAFHLINATGIPLREGQQVRLIVQDDESPDAVLAWAEAVYAGLPPEDVAEVQQIALERRNFFGKQA